MSIRLSMSVMEQRWSFEVALGLALDLAVEGGFDGQARCVGR
jgi:hypothetical protein